MAGPFGGPIAGPGECSCCGGPAPACGSTCITVVGCNLKSLTGATVTLGAKSVISIAVINGGSGYTVPPNVIISNASGNSCVATAVISGGVVTAINVTTGGAYSSTPGVTISAIGAGSGATATATLGSLTTVGTGTTTGQVATITRTNAGTGYTSQPTVTITGDGTGATAVANITAPILSFAVGNAGGGYTTAPTATVSTLTGGGGTARVLLTGTTVATVALGTPGSYSTAGTFPTVTLTTPTGHTGSGATAAPSLKVTSTGQFTGGTGYTAGDLISLSGGTHSITAVLKVTSVDGSGGITAVSIDTPGSYTAFPSHPTAVTGGSGSGATYGLTWQVIGVAVTAAGTNYSTAPTVAFAGFGGATATAALTPTTIASVTKVAGGAYSSTPGVTLSGGGAGSGGAITATLDTFTVASFTLTARGSGYTTAMAGVSGGGGSGATASVTVNNQVCFDIPNAGNYTITVNDALGRFQTNTSVTGLTCTASQARNITLTPDSAYVCFSCSSPVSAYPIKKVLSFSTPGGSGTVTLSGSQWFLFTPFAGIAVCDPPGGTTGTATVVWRLFTSPTAGGGFGCFGFGGPGYCGTNVSCVPASDAYPTPQTTTLPCISFGTSTWTTPESGGAFSLTITGLAITGILSGTFAMTE